jgi:hypothetical protein
MASTPRRAGEARERLERSAAALIEGIYRCSAKYRSSTCTQNLVGRRPVGGEGIAERSASGPSARVNVLLPVPKRLARLGS